jgi:hypothetical protein
MVVVLVTMTTQQETTPSTQKMRRDELGGKRGQGHCLQEQGQRVHRPDPRRLRQGPPDPSLTGAAGLVPFGAFLREEHIDERLRALFGDLKSGPRVVYGMPEQLRLLIDAQVLGQHRVFGLERLAQDPLFVHLVGGSVPSLDTVYRDLDRFGPLDLARLDALMAEQGLWKHQLRQHQVVHLDIDTTVEPLFGHQEGALPGPNPRYHGRPSYHPILCRIAETRTSVGALLRPGDTALGADDVNYFRVLVRRVKQSLRKEQLLRVRVDAAGDCTDLMAAIGDEGAHFLTKAKLTKDLLAAVFAHNNWRTVIENDDGTPARQVADIPFARAVWKEAGLSVRVIAVRTLEQTSGKQVQLWDDQDYTVKVYLTNDFDNDGDWLARDYEGRAGIEPLIGEYKHHLGIGAVPTDSFNANHALLLLKLLTYNLLRRFVHRHAPHLSAWQLPWLRAALLCVPARLVRSGRRLLLRLAQGSPLLRLLS